HQATQNTLCAQASPPHGGNGRIDQICGHQLKNFRVPVQNLHMSTARKQNLSAPEVLTQLFTGREPAFMVAPEGD
ncbi:MAG: hypothetical protein SV429_00820, partial [Pseudomonadota bacterium]|nr:hypothetical protein [Pseudomonadota bacterium]